MTPGDGIPDTRAPTGSGPEVEREHGGGSGSLAGSAPPPLYFEEITPSGIEVRYFPENKDEKIKRHYEIRAKYGNDDNELTADFIAATQWRQVPSVTTIIDKFKDPGALIWWGMKKGAEGTVKLFNRGHLSAGKLPDGSLVMGIPRRPLGGQPELQVATEKTVVELLQKHKLTTNDVKDAAGERGTNVHTAFEIWAKTGEISNPDDFPPEERGYVAGLNLFLIDLEPLEPEIVATERMIASMKHGFAGRFDIELRTHRPGELVKRHTPKQGPKYFDLPPGLYVPDLKTSKQIMESHCIQAEGYEIGRKECGYEPSDGRMVLHVHPGDPKDDRQPDGPYYEFRESWAVEEDFLATLALYNQHIEMKGRK